MLLTRRSMDLWKVTCISYLCSIENYRFHLFWFSASSFNSQYLLLFLKSSRSCVLFLPTPFTSVVCPSRRQFLLRIWPIQLAFLSRILLFRRVLSPICPRTCSLVTFCDHFIFFILLQQHIFKLSKCFHSNFLSVQVSEPYKAMLNADFYKHRKNHMPNCEDESKSRIWTPIASRVPSIFIL